MIDKYIDLLSKDCNICNRKDYLIFIAFGIIFLLILIFASGVLYEFKLEFLANLIIIIVPLILIGSFIILSIKRFHDVNYSGYWIFSIFFFPVFLYLILQPSVTCKNKYIPVTEDENDQELNMLIERLEKENNGEKK